MPIKNVWGVFGFWRVSSNNGFHLRKTPKSPYQGDLRHIHLTGGPKGLETDKL